ncbi:hypothetical protein UlMin_003190 [Ulmus minor]
MFEGGIKLSLQTRSSPVLLGLVTKNRTQYRTRSRSRSNQSVTVQLSSILVQTDENGNLPEPNKIFTSGISQRPRTQVPNQLFSQPNTIGILGGVSAFSTLIFLEKLVWWGSKSGGCPPFVVCNDSGLHMELPLFLSPFDSITTKSVSSSNIENLRRQRVFLENSGASCIVMPCHISHVWHDEISEGSSLPFLHVGESVAKELKEAKLKPLEVGSNVKIGVLASSAALGAGIYQEKLQNQGFEVVYPDKATMEHVVIPAIEAVKRRDIKGARNLLKIAVQILLVRAVNTVLLTADEMQGVIPHDDPLLLRCTDPMDALARSTIRWAKSKQNMK